MSYSLLVPQGYPLYPPPFFHNSGVPSLGPGYFGSPNRYSGDKELKKEGPCFLSKESGHVVRECPKIIGKKE